MTRLILYVLAAVGFFTSRACGQDGASGDINAGREMASKLCGSCHLVGAGQNQPRSLAPSFEQIAEGSKTDTESLREFLTSTLSNVSHPGGMPNRPLSNDEIQKIGVYIRSLRRQ